MISGIGTDITDIRRIREDLAKIGARFETKVFTEQEILYCRAQADPALHYAARWAAKEAVLKALGTGWSSGIAWRDIEIQRRENSGPGVLLHGKALEIARDRGLGNIFLSLSHDGDMAVAFCVIEGADTTPSQTNTSKEIPFTLYLEEGLKLRGNLHLPAQEAKTPIFILCHGFKGFKDWGWVPWLCRELASRGIAALRFNFSRNGIGDAVDTFEDLPGFSRNTLGREQADLKVLFEALRKGEIPGAEKINLDRAILGGHSRGGGGVIIYGIENPKDCRGIVALAPVSHFDRFDTDTDAWKKNGVFYVANARTGQQMPILHEAYEEFLENRERYDLMNRVGGLHLPLLIIHGDKDETVPCQEGKRIATKVGLRGKLKLLEGANHTFGGAHPFMNPNRHLRQVLDEIEKFCRETAG